MSFLQGRALAISFLERQLLEGALKSRNPITAVDVQAFAAVLSDAMLNGEPADVEDGFAPNFSANFGKTADLLAAQFEPLIKLERRAMIDASKGGRFRGSAAAYQQRRAILDRRLSPALKATIKAIDGKTGDATVAYYFGGVYFSYAQAVHLDAIARAIEYAPARSRQLLRAALLSTCSEIVNTSADSLPSLFAF